ncbi:Zinc finger CCCH domain-containing protein 62 [Linum perenne]
MATFNQSKQPCRAIEEERDEDSNYSDLSDSSDLDCDSDSDPSFCVLDETNHKLSALSIEKKSRSRIVSDYGEEYDMEDGREGDDRVFKIADNMIKAGQVEKLKIDQCKAYLRKHGLRLTGCKATLIQRIKEHQEILDGKGEEKYPLSSFVINCKGDACTNDIVLFEQNVYDMYSIVSRSASGPPCGKRIVAGRIVKESYGAAKQQHTFTIEVLWSKGEKPHPPLHPLLIKGRNLYRLKTLRQRWPDEQERSRVLMEKHSRGSLARSNRETRITEKEKKKLLCKGRVSRKDPKMKQVDIVRSTEPAKMGSLLQQPSSGQFNDHQMPYVPQRDPIANRNPIFSLESRQMIPQAGSRPCYHAQNHEIYRGGQVPWDPMRYGGNQQHSREVPAPMNYNRQPLIRLDNRGPARASHHQKQPCKYYPQGRCHFGHNCKFSHQTEEVLSSFGQRREHHY